MNKIYGLFYNTFDYYGWSDVLLVSKDKQSLLDEFENKNNKTIFDGDWMKEFPLLSSDDAIVATKNESFHYTIKEIELI